MRRLHLGRDLQRVLADRAAFHRRMHPQRHLLDHAAGGHGRLHFHHIGATGGRLARRGEGFEEIELPQQRLVGILVVLVVPQQAVPQFLLPLQVADVLGQLGERLLVQIGNAPDDGVDGLFARVKLCHEIYP
ncbi:MAG: hypothetical protein H6644_16385 [Caldilineaceae bacterium]|nr:hypothetical protein [Caldilineaceae bacterium]